MYVKNLALGYTTDMSAPFISSGMIQSKILFMLYNINSIYGTDGRLIICKTNMREGGKLCQSGLKCA
jgi:hypothetical protein